MKEELGRKDHEEQMIYEPLQAYKMVYKDLHHKNVTEYFDVLVKKSQIDVEANRQTVKRIHKYRKEHTRIIRQIQRQNTVRALQFLMILIMAGVIYFCGYKLAYTGISVWPIVGIMTGVGSIIFSIIFIVKQKPKLEALHQSKQTVEHHIDEAINEAWEQMRPLNELFRPDMCRSLFQKTLPLIHLDKMFDNKRLEFLVRRFGFNAAKDPNRSTLFVQSGDIHGNPFFLANDLVHEMGKKTYTGSKVITYTTTRTVNGKRVTTRHTQVLTASIERPCPFYRKEPYLVYGNDAAPDLIFSRTDSDAERMSDKELERHVRREIRKLRRQSRKKLMKGESFTVMGHSEFEVLFGATNRNNEVQFRLLFTPLAQKQLLDLMKDKEVGFGDDFDFIKHKKINIIIPKHLKQININPSAHFFQGYDIDEVREKFIKFNDAYFKHIYFAFAPILAIPLYQQHKPHEYIYEGLYDSYVCFYEHEYVANSMNVKNFKHPLSVTPNILKTSVINSENNRDLVKVTAYGYRTVDRVEYVPKWGRDGRLHQIPVRWTEYIPVTKETELAIHVVEEEKEKSIYDKVREVIEDIQKRKGIPERDIYRVGALVAYIVNKAANKQ